MIGRVKELNQLKGLLESDLSEFAVVYGRRRIGKTFLINEAFGYSFAFHHAGLKTGTMREQLAQFRLSLMSQGYRECPALKDWLTAFYELENFLSRSKATRKVVFIDEMPWLDTPRSSFLSALESFWNNWASFRKDVVLIACGSATSWIVKNIIRNKDGLYGRVRLRIKLFPFTLAECEAYANGERHLGYGRRDIAECYMALGGVAYYWSILEKGKSPAQNIDTLFFSRQDGLRVEYDELYRSLFRHPDRHMAIVEALGGRRDGLTRDELMAALGTDSGGDVTRCLDDLESCGFIRLYHTSATGKNGGNYQLIDPFTLFYRRFVQDNASRSGDYWQSELSEGAKNEWRGFAFERLCLEHVPQLKTALGIAGVHADVYSLRVGGNAKRRGAQIDLLLDRRDGIVNLCEMKYASGEYVINAEEGAKLRNRIEAFREKVGKRRSIHLTLITSEGLAHKCEWGMVQSTLTLDDLFASVKEV